MDQITRGEYLERVDLVKERMRSVGIDVMIATEPANIDYLTGYFALSYYVTQLVIIDLQRDEPIWIGRGQDELTAKRTTWLSPENVHGYGDEYVPANSANHPMDYVVEVLRQIGNESARIGVEMDGYYFSAKAYNQLRRGLSGGSFSDQTLLVNEVRKTKSKAELAYIRQAAAIADAAMLTAVDAIDEGVRGCDAAAEVCRTLVQGTDVAGGDLPAAGPFLKPASGHVRGPHLTWSDRKYVEGDQIVLEIPGVVNHYHAPLTRTLYVGDPPEIVTETAEIIINGLEAAIGAMEPGVKCEAVERAWRDAIAGTHIVKESRIGYTTGLAYPPIWTERTASIRPGDTTLLEPNMVFHMLPGIWLEEFGMAFSETVRITDDGVEVLTDTPRRLFTK